MKLHQIWMAAALALSVQSGAAFADVVLGTKNDPNALLMASFGPLLGAEKSTQQALSAADKAALANGLSPKARPNAREQKIEYTADWLRAQPAPSAKLERNPEFTCMKQALYFESRGEGIRGQFAVAEVILNRVDSPLYPNTICKVVEQGNAQSCQFSYNCDGKAEVMHDKSAADLAGRIAQVMMQGAPRTLTAGATHFHTRAVNPRWSRIYEQTASIGAHLFYRK
jgi:spore germination cell wall hydrolase CwlJ-like protein